jgi:hypothetical protein
LAVSAAVIGLGLIVAVVVAGFVTAYLLAAVPLNVTVAVTVLGLALALEDENVAPLPLQVTFAASPGNTPFGVHPVIVADVVPS